MDLRRLSQGEKIAVVSALVLLGFTFLDWYGVKVSAYGLSASASVNAWDALDVIPILLSIAIGGTFLMALLKLGEAEVELAIDGPRIIAVLGAASFALIFYRLIDLPMIVPGDDASSVERSLQIGIFLSLVAAAGMAFGGWRAMREADPWRSTASQGSSGGDDEAAAEGAAARGGERGHRRESD